ncbi:MAG: 30S ribosomal protein S2 [Phycisphaerae bacterium]|nr:30S ribosomal protein S2 [Phycisphaerae bacterium]
MEAGVHFGHRVSRWNPKMARYIFGKRELIHVIDIRETIKGLLRAKKLVSAIVSGGQDVLFVGTKRQAREAIQKQAQRVGMHYVAERWLGGTLTNFRTIRSRLQRLEELEAAEQTGSFGDYSKKMKSTLQRELRKIRRNLEGIRNMSRLPGALIVVDVKREYIAVREARKLGIPTIGVVDTDSDPDSVDLVIPGNDDAMRALELIIAQLADAVDEGKRARSAESEEPAAGESARHAPRRGRRLAAAADAVETGGGDALGGSGGSIDGDGSSLASESGTRGQVSNVV